MSVPSVRTLLVRGAVSLATAVAFLLLDGCSESATTSPGKGGMTPFTPASLFTGRSTTYGFIRISHETVGDSPTTRVAEGQVRCGQGFSGSMCYDAGTMTAGGLTFRRDTLRGYWMSDKDLRFGGVSRFGVAGNTEAGIPRIIDSLYVPSVVYMRAPVAPNGPDIEQTWPLEIRWNTDHNNDSVLVYIRYNADISRKQVAALPADDFWWYAWVPDSGAYEVTSSILLAFPVKGYVTVGVLRGRAKIIGPPSYPVDAYGYSKSEGIFRLAP